MRLHGHGTSIRLEATVWAIPGGIAEREDAPDAGRDGLCRGKPL
jgi:predicted DNA-binding ribbon-helix-helix protein